MSIDDRYKEVTCPNCGATPGNDCKSRTGRACTQIHAARVSAYVEAVNAKAAPGEFKLAYHPPLTVSVAVATSRGYIQRLP